MPLNHNIKSSNTTTRHEPNKAPTSTTTSTSSSKPQQLPNANGIIRQDKSKRELAAYYAATAFNMRPSTIIRAIDKNYLDSWPGLTSSLIIKYLIKSITFAKGHLDQDQKNLQSTKNDIAIKMGEIPTQEPDNSKTSHICAVLISIDDLPSKSYSDQPCTFPT